MILDWFDTKEVSRFGILFAESINEKIPSTIDISKNPLSNDQKTKLIKLFEQVSHFRKTHSLNFYKKAKLGNVFRWKMLDLGYQKEWVDELTYNLMQILQR